MPFSTKLLVLLMVYCLFALWRIKAVGAPVVDGLVASNVPLLTGAVLVVAMVSEARRWSRYSAAQVASYLLLGVLGLTGCLQAGIDAQSLYALAAMLIPLAVGVFYRGESGDFALVLRVCALLGVLYAVFTIVAVFDYSGLLRVVGITPAGDYGQHRASLPLGSSITVSYYLNICLVIVLYLYLKTGNTRGRLGWLASCAAICAAITLELSRSSVACMVLTLVLYATLSPRGARRPLLLVYLAIGASLVYVALTSDVSRLVDSFFGSSGLGESGESRGSAASLGLHLFASSPLFGTGVGECFPRVWSGDNRLVIDGVAGLVDPHSGLVLLLSELGLVGTFLYFVVFGTLVVEIWSVPERACRAAGLTVAAVVAINSLYGSQIVNEPAYAVIAYFILAGFAGAGRGGLACGEN